MANISKITDRLYTGGDLPTQHPAVALADLLDWKAEGITHVIDCRIEWSDEDFVTDALPGLTYLHLGVDDAGQTMPDEWFETGVAAAKAALEDPDAVVLAHCHMGINRGPSMAFAVMLAHGWDFLEALNAIRAARPIAAVGYAHDAIDWWLRRQGVDDTERGLAQDRFAQWRIQNDLDVSTIIRRIRNQEQGA